MHRKNIATLLSLILVLFLLCSCGSPQTEDPGKDITGNSIMNPADVIFEPLYAESAFTAGYLNPENGKIEDNQSFAYILNYPVKKGRVLSISDQKFQYSIVKYENGSYSNTIKDYSIKNFTVQEDMNIAISICKSDRSVIAAEELAKVALRDTLFRMTDVTGNIHRFYVDAETIDGNTQKTRAAVFMPTTYSDSGNANKLILMTNGHKGFLSDLSWYSNSPENTQLIDAYLENGYAVLIVDNTAGVEGKTSDMGCPQLVSSYFKACEYVQQHFNIEKQIYLHSRSFGTFAAIRLMREQPELFKCAIMTGPRVSMQKEWDEKRPDKDHVAKRFGFSDLSGQTYEADKLVGHDPYTDIKAGDYTLPPTFWMMAKNDMTERPEEFIADLKNQGNDVTFSTYTGLDHSAICALDGKQPMADAFEYLSKY